MSGPSVLHLLLGRETGLGACHGGGPTSSAGLDSELERWVEDDMVEHTSSDYVTFQPPPRSTIAVAYNSDGSLLASSQCVLDVCVGGDVPCSVAVGVRAMAL